MDPKSADIFIKTEGRLSQRFREPATCHFPHFIHLPLSMQHMHAALPEHSARDTRSLNIRDAHWVVGNFNDFALFCSYGEWTEFEVIGLEYEGAD